MWEAAHMMGSRLFRIVHTGAFCGLIGALWGVLELPCYSHLLAVWGDHQQGLGGKGVQRRVKGNFLLMQP